MANTLFFTALILIWVMLLYHMFLMQGGYRHYRTYERVIPKWEKNMTDLPTVSVFIPSHNEEVVMAQTLTAMSRLYYPKDKLDIIVINDNSSDRTGEIAQEFADRYPFIRVLETKPPNKGKGKSSALNEALANSKGEIICVYDADNTPEKKGGLVFSNGSHK